MENRRKVVRGHPCPNHGRHSFPSLWCGKCYANKRGKGRYAGHAYYRPMEKKRVPFEEYVIMKRPEQKTAGGSAASGTCSDEQFAKKYPTIVMYLTDDKYDDGTPRELSQVSLSVRDGMIALALNDKDLKQSVYTMGDTLQEALKLMEGAVADSTAQWRPWKEGKRRK